MLKFTIHYTINAMKTITLTDEQFDTLFDYVDNKVHRGKQYRIG